MNAKTFSATMIIVPLLISGSFAAEVKPGWNKENREKAVRGCAAALMEPHMEAIRKGLYKPEIDAARRAKLAVPETKKMYTSTCACVTEKASERWSLKEFNEISKDRHKWQKFLKELFCSRACTQPFDAPLNCR